MAKCDVCGQYSSCRALSRVTICEDCFAELQKLRNGDREMIYKYSDPMNLMNATPNAEEYLKETLEDVKKKIYNLDKERLSKIAADEKRALLDKQRQEAKRTEFDRRKNFIMTTTPNIEGYVITQYLGIVTGEESIGTGFFSEMDAQISDFLGGSATAYSSKLGKAKSIALKHMRENALSIGATAIVGIDIDIMNTSSNIFIVCANGTAVIAKKKKPIIKYQDEQSSIPSIPVQ